jgi:hypothetical protein
MSESSTQLVPRENHYLARGPRAENGELALAEVLDRLRWPYDYERWTYSFYGRGFTPDFNLAARGKRPAINVELTWADQGLNTERHEDCVAILRRKAWKAHQTRELYGIRTVLVTFRDWLKIMANSAYLYSLIDQELTRKYEIGVSA